MGIYDWWNEAPFKEDVDSPYTATCHGNPNP
ncbi:uncharacterized protein G2W53_019043 [Senna tora]|uniref:Uncharacterized protein n=1 Tax=Senna tora TaxID=362788 RepID=A0A834U1L6_9FABA|nr:uncharacterized protein G2W53_019043 [Senna tora]